MGTDAVEAIAEAARWRLLGLLFERPRAGWREDVAALAREVRDPTIASLAERAGTEREGVYLALLGPGAPVSPREVAYRGLADPGWVLADIQRYYEAFAYRPQVEDPIDHVAVEAGFVAYLLLKEEMARAAGDQVGVVTTAAGRDAFIEAHLGVMAAPLARALTACADSCVAAAATLLAARLPPCGAPERDAAATPLACQECAARVNDEPR
jgi:hypothetical protein